MKQIINSYNLNVVCCGYDDHNAAEILKDLESMLNCDLTEIVQSAKSLNDATVDFQLAVKGGLVCYDKNNSLLSWSAVNTCVIANSFGEIKIDKKLNTGRIDAIDAIIDAWKLYIMNKKTKKIDGNAALKSWLKIVGGGDNE